MNNKVTRQQAEQYYNYMKGVFNMINTNKTPNNSSLTVKVFRARQFNENNIVFDMLVNDAIRIYGCWYRQGIKNGNPWSMISFPSWKGNDGKYHNVAYFYVDDAMKQNIERQIESLLGGETNNAKEI